MSALSARKEKLRQQFDAVMPSMMETGEQPIAGSVVMSGPSPWLIGPLFQHWYFIEVTDRRVLFIKCSKSTVSPKGLAWADPRDSVQVHDVAMDGGLLHGKFGYRRSNGEDIRINVDRFWREDAQAVVAALTSNPQHAADGSESANPL
jgi:hypothetical protein